MTYVSGQQQPSDEAMAEVAALATRILAALEQVKEFRRSLDRDGEHDAWRIAAIDASQLHLLLNAQLVRLSMDPIRL